MKRALSTLIFVTWRVRNAYKSLFVLTGLSDLESLERIGELESVGNERLQVDEASRDEGDGHGVVAWAISEVAG
jgi:hypothetical protein